MRRRSKQVAEARPLDGVRSMWEFVFISQILRFFQDKFGFVHFEVEELENAFLEAENYPLFSVFARLLRLLLRRSDIRISNWEETLKVELEERGAEPNPLDEGNYGEIAADDRVLLLKYIIDYICDVDDENFKEIKEFKEDFLNHESENIKPIGQDAQGYVYWYFDDLRLYREKTTKKGIKRSWATVCTTSEDWENIIKSLQKNKENEKKLHDYLQDELYPSIEPLLKEHEKEKDQLKNKKKKLKSIKSKKELSKEEERDALIKQEEEEIERMKQEEESQKQRTMENEHRKKGRRRKEVENESSSPDTNDEKEMESRREQEEIQKRIAEEIERQESLVTAEDIESGLVPRTRRKCVIMREQTKKKKEWWDEEGIGSDLEDDEDLDSDSSDGPRRRKKKPKLMKPVEPPGPMNRTYVFSTALANRAAEAVQQGRVENIVSYHRAQQTTSPYVRLEKERTFDKSYDQQKAYFAQGYPQQPAVGAMMSRGYGRIPGMHPDSNPGSGGRPGYNPAQWQQFQMQPQYMKERQQRQAGVDDLSQILFGGAVNGNGQNAPATGSYPQRMPGQQYGYPQRMGTQQQPYQDNRMPQEGYRPQFQQGYNQQQQYFQRPRNLPQLHSPGAQSPSSDPLGANVRSPPPPYPGARSGEARPQHHMGNSPAAVPSPTSTGSPQTPLTPHTPRFPGAVPSPGEPSKPPFSPTNPQQSNYSAGTFAGQPQRPGSESSGSDTGGDVRQGYADLGSKGYAPTTQQQGYAVMADNNQDNIQSPTEPRPMGGSNKSPFLVASQAMSSASASMPKSFSVESLTAPSVPSDQAGHPLTADQQMGPYSGIYYQTKYQPTAMYGGQRYQYPSTIQHSGAFYNSQLPSNMYLDRGSMQVYPPGRESGL